MVLHLKSILIKQLWCSIKVRGKEKDFWILNYSDFGSSASESSALGAEAGADVGAGGGGGVVFRGGTTYILGPVEV